VLAGSILSSRKTTSLKAKNRFQKSIFQGPLLYQYYSHLSVSLQKHFFSCEFNKKNHRKNFLTGIFSFKNSSRIMDKK
jgi:hypothetical protein